MTTLHQRGEQHPSMKIATDSFASDPLATEAGPAEANPYKMDFVRVGADRRDFRRHDLEQQSIAVSRWSADADPSGPRDPQTFGRLIDLSAGGARIRTSKQHARTAGRIRVRLELPAYAGISPFISAAEGEAAPRPTREWVGHMEVARVRPVAGRDEVELAGRLVDMAEADRGMLGLYLSTQPLAA